MKKALRAIIAATLMYVVFFSSTFSLSSCTKENPDTVIVRDTVIIRDSTCIKDTTCNCKDSLSVGLIAYYNFNGGNLNDSSGNNNNIFFNNAVKTTDRYGVVNNAYLFNGSSSYMQVKNSASLNPAKITIMSIVKVNGFYNSTCHGNEIVSKGFDNNNGYYGLRFTDKNGCSAPVNTSTEYFYGAYGNQIFTTSGTSALADTAYIQTGHWYTVVYTYDGQQSKIYVDGILHKTFPRTAAFTANTEDLLIGKHGLAQYPYWLNGAIDEVRIYNRALSEADVKKLSSLSN